jgi:hypothetical protein
MTTAVFAETLKTSHLLRDCKHIWIGIVHEKFMKQEVLKKTGAWSKK